MSKLYYFFVKGADELSVFHVKVAFLLDSFAFGFLHELDVAVSAGLLLRRNLVQSGPNL